MEYREKTISKVTLWGAAGNMALTVFKLVAGILGHSSAMTADAIHSVSDLVSDIVVLVLVKLSGKGKDRDHDYGHGKFETLATAIIALMLLVIGIKMFTDGVSRIGIALKDGGLPVPGTLALAAALVSIVVKEILYQWTAHTGRKLNSPAMISNAWHHRSDALSSIGSALGIGGAMALGGRWVVLDPIAGCVISIFIMVISVKMAIPALHELTEGSLPDDVEEDIVSLISAAPGIISVHELKTRKNGPSIILSAHVVVNPEISVQEAHKITVDAEQAVRNKYGNETQISIHVEPDEESD